MSEKSFNSIETRNVVLWNAEPRTFAPVKSTIIAKATARDCMAIALCESDIDHRREPVWLLGKEKNEIHFMFHTRGAQGARTPAPEPRVRVHLTFGSLPAALGDETPERGSPTSPATSTSSAQEAAGGDPNDLDLDNPIIDQSTGEAVTEVRAALQLKLWKVKTNYTEEKKMHDEALVQYKKQVEAFLVIIQANLGTFAMESISREFKGRDPPVVWAKIIELGEADQETTLNGLHRKRNHISLKECGNITKLQTELERLHKLIVAAGDVIPSDASSVAILHDQLGKFEAFDIAIAIRNEAGCNDLNKWW